MLEFHLLINPPYYKCNSTKLTIYGGIHMNTHMSFGAHETILNHYYNISGFNHRNRIGSIMDMIRKCKPLAVNIWRDFYLTNAPKQFNLNQLITEFWQSIPAKYQISRKEASDYVNDVMFRRTFSGYNKEQTALHILRNTINPNIQESPAEWDINYSIDFYFNNSIDKLIGIQLKPESFFYGHYEKHSKINRKLDVFRNLYHAEAYVLYYRQHCDFQNINQFFTNSEIIQHIKQL